MFKHIVWAQQNLGGSALPRLRAWYRVMSKAIKILLY